MKKIILRTLLVIFLLIVVLVIYTAIIIKSVTVISTGETIPEYENQKSALIVIDIQEGTSGEFSILNGLIEQSDSLINAVNRIIAIADSNNMPIVYITQETENWLINLASSNCLAKGSPGAAIDSRVNVVSQNHFSKTIF